MLSYIMKKNQKLTKSKLDRNQIHPIERISKYWNVSENNHCLISKALNFPSHKDIKLLKPRIYQQNLNCTKESNQGTAFFLVSFKMKTLTVIALTVASASPYWRRNPVAEATPIKVVVSLSFKNNMIKVSYNAWNSVIQIMFIFFHFKTRYWSGINQFKSPDPQIWSWKCITRSFLMSL